MQRHKQLKQQILFGKPRKATTPQQSTAKRNLICEEAEEGGQDAGGTRQAEAGVADVDVEEVREEVGIAVESGERSGHEGRGAVHQEHGAGHEVRNTVEAGVGAFVQGEVFDAKGVG